MTTTTTIRDGAPGMIRRREAFRASELSGAFLTVGTAGPGEMPAEWVPAWRDAVKTYGRRLYVVRSFETPIAWIGDDGSDPVIPDVTYGNRTTRHQTVVRVAWNADYSRLPGEVQVRVVKVTRGNGSSGFRVTGPFGTRTFGFDYEAPLSGKYEAAATAYAVSVCGMRDTYFRVHERFPRVRRTHPTHYFVLVPVTD